MGTVQTAFHDGYSGYGGRKPGPQILVLDYSALVPLGMTADTFTLGIAADDFQRPLFGQPYTASINGIPNVALTNVLNSLDQTGPQVQFFTIGLAPSALATANILTLSINQGGTGGDGWAVDFLTAGVTTKVLIPEPATQFLLSLGLMSLGLLGRQRTKR